MKKRKNVVLYDQDYIDCVMIFNEYLENGMPELDAEESEDDAEESVWIISSYYIYRHERKSNNVCVYGAFKTYAEAKCYLRQIKHDLSNIYKFYISDNHMKGVARDNKNIEHIWKIEKVYYLK